VNSNQLSVYSLIDMDCRAFPIALALIRDVNSCGRMARNGHKGQKVLLDM
jgi:hypothetical protein